MVSNPFTIESHWDFSYGVTWYNSPFGFFSVAGLPGQQMAVLGGSFISIAAATGNDSLDAPHLLLLPLSVL